MSFGFSASDFVTFGKLILDVTTALQDVGGAKSEYQDLVRELESLNTILRHLDKLDCDTQTASQTVLSIKYTALSCRHPLEVFLAKTQKYQRSLGVWSRSSTIRTAADKLRWSFGYGDEARRLQVFLNVYINTLNILLTEHGFERMDLSDMKSDAHAQAAHDQLEKANAAISQIGKDFRSQALMVRSVQSMLSSLYTLVCGDMKTSLQHFSHVVNGVCVRTQKIYNVVLQVRDSLATLDTRWTHFQECIRVEDALGLRFTIPSECDYSMLTTIIHRRFDSGPGAADVYAGNYEFNIANKRSELVTVQTKLAPGLAITMAIIISTGRNSETRCPMTQCGSLKIVACPGGVLSCKDCGVKFDRATKKRRRFEEFGNEDLNITGSTASHCTTCTCCRPSKRPKMKSMDVKEQRAVFRNVRWALDEDGQSSPTKVCKDACEDDDQPARSRQKTLLQLFDFESVPWKAPASSDYVKFGLELIGAPPQHPAPQPSQVGLDDSIGLESALQARNMERWGSALPSLDFRLLSDEYVHARAHIKSMRYTATPLSLPTQSTYYNQYGNHFEPSFGSAHDPSSFLPQNLGSPLTAFAHLDVDSNLSSSWYQQPPYSSLPQAGRRYHISPMSQIPSIKVTGTAGSDFAPPHQDFAAFASIDSQASPLQLNTNFNFNSTTTSYKKAS